MRIYFHMTRVLLQTKEIKPLKVIQSIKQPTNITSILRMAKIKLYISDTSLKLLTTALSLHHIK